MIANILPADPPRTYKNFFHPLFQELIHTFGITDAVATIPHPTNFFLQIRSWIYK